MSKITEPTNLRTIDQLWMLHTNRQLKVIFTDALRDAKRYSSGKRRAIQSPRTHAKASTDYVLLNERFYDVVDCLEL
jgi:hypothetical protein